MGLTNFFAPGVTRVFVKPCARGFRNEIPSLFNRNGQQLPRQLFDGITGIMEAQQFFPGWSRDQLTDHHWPLFGSSTYFPLGRSLGEPESETISWWIKRAAQPVD